MTIISIGILTIFVTRLMNLQVSCLNSKFVSSVEFVSGDGQHTLIQQCSFIRELMNPKSLTLDQQKMIQRIHDLNVLTNFVDTNRSKKFLQITDADPFVVEMGDNYLRLGTELAKKGDQFKQNFLLFWLASRTDENHQLESQVVSQFLLRTELGVKWYDHLMTSQEYCLSDQRSLFHFEGCRASQNISSAALAPILAKILILTEQLLPLSERVEMFRRVAHGWLPLRAWPREFKTIGEVEKALNLFIDRELESFTTQKPEARAQMAAILRKKIGLGEPMRLLVDIHSPKLTLERLPKLIQLSSRFRNASIAVIRGEKLTFLPTLHSIPRTILPAEHYVYVTCAMPSLKELSKINSQRVTVFRLCRGDENMNWDQLLISQINQSIPRDFEFVRLYIPSLRFALENSKLASLGETRIDEVTLLSKTFDWQQTSWNKKEKYFEPHGSINAITAYRFGQKTETANSDLTK